MAQLTISSADGVLSASSPVNSGGVSTITLTLSPVVAPAPTPAPQPKPLRLVDGIGYVPDDGKAYSLVQGASDDFGGAALDAGKWWTRYRDNAGTLDHYNDELQRYVDNHVVSGGTLKLTAKPRPTTLYTAPTGKTYPMYDSSMVRSKATFKYGYVEIRAKVPPGLGVWPAFWILSDGAAPCELDVLEYVRNDKTEFQNIAHVGLIHNAAAGAVLWQAKDYNAQYGYWKAPYNFPAAYHVFSMLWEAGIVTAYVDGQPVVQRACDWKTNAGADGGLASVIANLAMGGSWPTANWTTDVATDPQIYEIGHIRVYQVSGQSITGVSAV